MNKKIMVVDFSQLSYMAMYAKENQKIETDWDFWRYLILKRITASVKLLKPDKVILAIDKGSWRTDVTKHYKARRKVKNAKSPDKKELYNILNDFIIELKNIFMYQIIQVDNTEADDIIGIIAHYLKEDFVYIVSSDKDFIQLLALENVLIYDPNTSKFIGQEFPITISKKIFNSPKEFTVYQIMNGDPVDDIPNILSSDDVFIDETKKQTRFGYKKIMKIYREEGTNWIKNQSDIIKQNFERNKKLVIMNANYIPKIITDEIIRQYKENEIVGCKESILEYFNKKKMKTLIDLIDWFVF